MIFHNVQKVVSVLSAFWEKIKIMSKKNGKYITQKSLYPPKPEPKPLPLKKEILRTSVTTCMDSQKYGIKKYGLQAAGGQQVTGGRPSVKSTRIAGYICTEEAIQQFRDKGCAAVEESEER